MPGNCWSKVGLDMLMRAVAEMFFPPENCDFRIMLCQDLRHTSGKEMPKLNTAALLQRMPAPLLWTSPDPPLYLPGFFKFAAPGEGRRCLLVGKLLKILMVW